MKAISITDVRQLLAQIILDTFDINDIEDFYNNGFELEINDGHIVSFIQSEITEVAQ